MQSSKILQTTFLIHLPPDVIFLLRNGRFYKTLKSFIQLWRNWSFKYDFLSTIVILWLENWIGSMTVAVPNYLPFTCFWITKSWSSGRKINWSICQRDIKYLVWCLGKTVFSLQTPTRVWKMNRYVNLRIISVWRLSWFFT